MTVTVNDRRKTYAGNGVATVFVGPRTFSAGWISAYRTVDATGVVTNYTSSDFAVTNVGNATSTVTFNVAPPALSTLTILRTAPVEQAYRFVNQGAFLPELHENAYDALAMIAQQHDAGLLFPIESPGQYLRWKIGGGGLESVTDLVPTGNFLQSGTGAVLRTATAKMGETVSILDYIPVTEHAAIFAGTSTYDCTSAIQSAVNNHPSCTAPAGTFLITGVITIPAGNTLLGIGMHESKFTRAGVVQSYFVLLSNAKLCDVGLMRSGASVATSGRLVDVSVSGCTVSGIYADHCWDGIYITNCAGAFIERINVNGWQNSGVSVDGTTNDVFLDQFILTSGATGAGIRLNNKAEAITISNGDVIGGVYSVFTSAAAFTLGAAVIPAYCKFTNCYFDNSTTGVWLDKTADFRFTSCWFSNRPSHGAVVNQCYDTHFVNCDFMNCGSSGALLNHTGIRNANFIDCSFISNNSQVNGSNGLTVGAGISDWSVIGGCANNSIFVGNTQGYGIYVTAGASDNYIVQGVNLRGNGSGGMFDGGTGVDKKIGGNISYVVPATAPTLVNSWVNLGSGTQDAGYWKDADGIVHLQGMVTGGTIPNTICTLPVGFRPAANQTFGISSNGAFGSLQVTSAGAVNPIVGNTAWVSLCGIMFKAA